MIVILLPGFAGNLKGRRAPIEDTTTPSPDADLDSTGDKVLPHTAPYTRNQANEIYCGAVRLARTMLRIRKLDQSDGDLADLSMRLHQAGIVFGRKYGITTGKIVSAFDTIEQVTGNTAPTTEDLQWEGHVRADEEFVTRALPLLFLFAQEGGDQLAKQFRHASQQPAA
jgi:hypothetical protein